MRNENNQSALGAAQGGLSFRRMQRASILVLLLVLCAIASFNTPTFLTWLNLVDTLLTSAAPIGVIALGMTFVMIAGGFDLSVASTTAVCTVVLVMVMNALGSFGAPAAIAGAIMVTALVGTALGAVNGILIAYVGVNPFVVTLSTMLVFRGLALILTGGGQSLQIADLALRARFTWFYDTRLPLFGATHQISIPIIIFLVLFSKAFSPLAISDPTTLYKSTVDNLTF